MYAMAHVITRSSLLSMPLSPISLASVQVLKDGQRWSQSPSQEGTFGRQVIGPVRCSTHDNPYITSFGTWRWTWRKRFQSAHADAGCLATHTFPISWCEHGLPKTWYHSPEAWWPMRSTNQLRVRSTQKWLPPRSWEWAQEEFLIYAPHELDITAL